MAFIKGSKYVCIVDNAQTISNEEEAKIHPLSETDEIYRAAKSHTAKSEFKPIFAIFNFQQRMLKPISESWRDFQLLIPDLISKYQLQDICEIGAGANPVLSEEFVFKRRLSYTLVDIDANELAKGNNNFKKRIIDFSAQKTQDKDKYDLVFSKMTLEHICFPSQFHQNVHTSLKTGGIAVHFFATLYSIPSITNLLLPDFISDKILFFLQKRDPVKEGKFLAYYRWSLGPVKKNINRFESLGFRIMTYDGYLGHGYLRRIKILKTLEHYFSSFLLKLNSPYFTSNAIVVLKKQELKTTVR